VQRKEAAYGARKEAYMPRYMGIHTFPKGAYSYEQLCQVADASQQDERVKGYRSFVSPSEGRAVCILDGPDRKTVEEWFRTMNLPTDAVCEVEIEGEGGRMKELGRLETVGTGI
jgi:hypothetical protein